MLVEVSPGRFEPLDVPERPDVVFATIDTAAKTGKEHDGTAVVYWAYSRRSKRFPLVILDWDLVQIEGALLETWLPNVFKNLESFVREFQVPMGSQGAYIEDASSGTMLLQQAKRRNMPVHSLPEDLKKLGKDGRAISVSGYVYRGLVKFSRRAFEKVVTFKGDTRNHLLVQISDFRVGDKNANKRADDALDSFVYGVAIALGNAKGF
jgi:phage terminase large subunit-like protein